MNYLNKDLILLHDQFKNFCTLGCEKSCTNNHVAVKIYTIVGSVANMLATTLEYTATSATALTCSIIYNTPVDEYIK